MLNFFDPHRPPSDHIRQQLRDLKKDDIPIHSGRTFAYVYEPSDEAYRLIQDAYMMYLTENGLDPTAFQSLLFMERDVVDTAIQIMGGDDLCAGNFTFGGTESIMLAVKAARDYHREHRPDITRPNIVLPVTGHAAFHKACHYLDISTKIVPIDRDTYTPTVVDMDAAIDRDTIMIVASAPSYAHGVIDPVAEISYMAQERHIWCHIDACVGGMYLPFSRAGGYDIPPFDFSLPGVTSISVDFHKYGYTAKGASCILYKSKAFRKHQIYTCSDWSGYSVVNPTVLSSKSGGSLAACWANLNLLGAAGYQDIVLRTQAATERVISFVLDHPQLYLLGTPVMNMISIASDTLNLFEIAKHLKHKGWYIQVQFAHRESPTNIHLSINQSNVPHIDEFIVDFSACTDMVQGGPNEGLPINREQLAQLTPGMINVLKSELQLEDGEVPEDLTIINQLLDTAPPDVRKMILTEFINDLMR